METLKKAIAAGFMIGIGAVIYIRCENKVVGAMLFTVGLFTICAFGMNLFTGKIGYIISNKNDPNCFIIWAGNLLGAAISMTLIRIAKPDIQEKAKAIMDSKLAVNPLAVIILAFFCGILMYVAVDNYRTNPHGIGKIIGLFLCVSVFILAGFEHSIANMCYAALALDNIGDLPRYLLFLLEATAGNGLGALAVHFITKKKD